MYQSWMHPTLYTPATKVHLKTLHENCNLVKPGKGIYRVVIDTEDSLHDTQIEEAISVVGEVVGRLREDSRVAVFVRVRNTELFKRVLDLPNIDRLIGFVLPKITADSFEAYAEQVVSQPQFRLMPILESEETFDRTNRLDLRAMLSDDRYRPMIDCVRIGATDLLGCLDLRRSTERTIYDSLIGQLIKDIASEFKIKGFPVSAPVFEGYGPDYVELMHTELTEDVSHGLFGKTCINPRQIPLIREHYRPSQDAVERATNMLSGITAVIGRGGRMDESRPMSGWAHMVLEREQLFGNREDLNPL